MFNLFCTGFLVTRLCSIVSNSVSFRKRLSYRCYQMLLAVLIEVLLLSFVLSPLLVCPGPDPRRCLLLVPDPALPWPRCWWRPGLVTALPSAPGLDKAAARASSFHACFSNCRDTIYAPPAGRRRRRFRFVGGDVFGSSAAMFSVRRPTARLVKAASYPEGEADVAAVRWYWQPSAS